MICDVKVEIPISITENLIYSIYENKKLIKEGILQAHTATAWGKEQIARRIGDVGTYYAINRIKAKYDTNWATVTVQNSALGGLDGKKSTLNVEGGTFSAAGTYTEVRCFNSASAANYHNTLACDVTLGAGQELVFTVKWEFTGLNLEGNRICASRLGAVGDSYDYIISVWRWAEEGGVTYWNKTTDRSVNGKTLIVETNVPHTITPSTVGWATYRFSDSVKFNRFVGFTIELAANQELYGKMEYVFG